MTYFLLVRHGQTDWNRDGRYQGRSDVPLNAAGREQAERLAAGLATGRIDAVYSSPLVRSLDTARALARRQGLEVLVDPRLIEIDQGEWEGLLASEIADRYAELHGRWIEEPDSVRPPGGEAIREVHDRVVAALEELAVRHPDGTVGVVTHKTAIVVARCHYLGKDLRAEMARMPHNATWEMIAVTPASRDPRSFCCSAAV